jgi:hypothetical protein
VYLGYVSVMRYQTYQTFNYTVKLEVTNETYVGFAVGKELNLGKIGVGQQSWRSFTLSHKYDKSLKVYMILEGVPYVQLSEYNLTLEPTTQRSITISANVPKNATLGKYEGNLMIYFMRW